MEVARVLLGVITSLLALLADFIGSDEAAILVLLVGRGVFADLMRVIRFVKEVRSRLFGAMMHWTVLASTVASS